LGKILFNATISEPLNDCVLVADPQTHLGDVLIELLKFFDGHD
jgi:hypothetical protein